MRKYFIAHLLSGAAKSYHETLSRELSAKFKTVYLSDRVPPHITLKAPFTADESEIEEVERVVKALARAEHAPPLRIEGFGRFGFRTIYLDIKKSPEAVAFMRRAIATLNANLPFLPRPPLEGNKLHTSVARFLTRRQSRRVWRHLGLTETPHFEVSLDTLALLEKDEKEWRVRTLVNLRPAEEEAGFSSFSSPSLGGEGVFA